MQGSEPSRIERYGVRALYILTGLLCCILGVVICISLSISCVFGGIFVICVGIFILITEAPFCCWFIPQTSRISALVDRCGPLPIAIVYGGFAIIALAMCFGVSTIFIAIFLLGSAALRIREFIQKRRAKSAGMSQDPEAARVGTQAGGVGPAPMYGGGYGDQSLMDRAVESAAKGAVQGAVSGATRPGAGGGGYPGY